MVRYLRRLGLKGLIFSQTAKFADMALTAIGVHAQIASAASAICKIGKKGKEEEASQYP